MSGRHWIAVLAVALCFDAAGSPAEAAMAPEYRRINEIFVLLQAFRDGGHAMRIGPLSGIEVQGPDHYRLRDGSCGVDARLHWPNPEPGTAAPGSNPVPTVTFDPPFCPPKPDQR